MGLVASVFRRDPLRDVAIDFDGATPDASDAALHQEATELLARGAQLLQQVQDYEPKPEYIRRALSENSHAAESEAFEAVRPNVDLVAGWWRFSQELEAIMPRMFEALVQGDVVDGAAAAIGAKQAVGRRLAELLEFVIRFDEFKMGQPGIQNDFSFYRRSLSKHAHEQLTVREDDASFISLFLANHIPLMTACSKAMRSASRDRDDLLQSLSDFTNACTSIVRLKKFEAQSPHYLLCLRAMTAGIVLFDHCDDVGAFAKKSPVAVKRAGELLVREFPREHPQLQASLNTLVNAIRFSTMHYSDAPDNVTAIFEQ